MNQDQIAGMRVTTYLLEDDGTFPNNPLLPLVILENAFLSDGADDPGKIESVFRMNDWRGSWRNGLYPFHHYHSTAHEVLGIFRGSLRAQFGGEAGPVVMPTSGDVIIIPAGVAHKNLWSSHDFRVVGAYPSGQSWDMNYGKIGERPAADKNINSVPLPENDPVLGKKGPLVKLWNIG